MLKITKKVNLNQRYLMIETLSQFIKQQYPMQDALNMCFELFKDESLLVLMEVLKQGQPIEKYSHLLYKDDLFIEFFNFYLYRESLDEALMKAMDLCKQKDTLKNEIRKAMTYPILLLSGVMVFSIIAITYLQPQFNQFFMSFDISFTLLQQTLMQLLFACPFVICITFIVIGGVVLFFTKQLKSQKFNELEKWFHYPIFNQILKKYISIKFCLYYKEFLYLGYDLHTILNMISQKIMDSHLQMVAFELIEEVKNGKDISEILDQFMYFDRHFKLIFKLSLSHQTPFTLFEQYYKTSIMLVKMTTHKFIQGVLPVLYGFIGVYIIGVYCGMILPMMNMLDKL